MTLHHVANVGEIAPGRNKLFTIGGKQIGVFHEEGGYYAVLNICPHALAPICQGRVEGTLTADASGSGETYSLDNERRVLRCPWHHWEFELDSGRAVCGVPQRIRTFPVQVEGDRILIDV